MIEFPESICLSLQLNENVIGKKVAKVLPATKVHKFCWFNCDASEYEEKIINSKIISAHGFGIYVEIEFDNGNFLCINDGVNIRLISSENKPENYQLLIDFDDKTALVFTVAMYGGIILHDSNYDNEYYTISKQSLSPLSPEFESLFFEKLTTEKQSLSAKAFLATQQRFPGIGNGVLQDILFAANILPQRKIGTFDYYEKIKLFNCTVSVLKAMVDCNGRDTEKDIFAKNGNYITKMSKNSIANGCPNCNGKIIKETYLGGSVYYCPNCQK